MSSKVAHRIVGGMFGLADPVAHASRTPPFLTERSLCLVNGRSAIALLLDRLTPRNVWVPSYICAAVVEAVETRSPLRFYGVDERLTVPDLGWLEDVRRGDLVIVVDYFGFPFDQTCARRAKELGAWVLRDACQALLTKPSADSADFVVHSPRKFLGVPDGGVLHLRASAEDLAVPTGEPPPQWWLRSLAACLSRRDFDLHGGGDDWFRLFQAVEASAPAGAFAMSSLARALLAHAFDYASIAGRRIANYQLVAEILHEQALFPRLPGGVVPMGCPIRVAERDRVRQALFENRIFPPVHWDIAGIVPESFRASHLLASGIMTLPCDQRYDPDDMRRMAELVAAEVGA